MSSLAKVRWCSVAALSVAALSCGGGSSGAEGDDESPASMTPTGGDPSPGEMQGGAGAASEPTVPGSVEAPSGSVVAPNPPGVPTSPPNPGVVPEPAVPQGQRPAACASIAAVCEPELVMDGGGTPFVLRMSGTGLFFRDGDNLQRVELPASAPSSVRLGLSSLIYFDITADQTLYYALREPGGVYRGDLLQASTDQVIATGTNFYGFVIVGNSLWQGGDSDTVRMALDGSGAQTVTGAGCVDLVADATHIYCRAGGALSGVIRIDQSTLAIEALQPVTTGLGDVEVTPRYAYSVPDLIDVSAPQNITLTRIDKTSLAVVDYDFAGSGNTLASDAAGVYVSVANPGSGPVIYYLADDMETGQPVVNGVGDGAVVNGSVGLSSTHVYFSYFTEGDPTSGKIYRAPRCGCR